MARFGTISASLILGIVWWAWHIPLFFISGLVQNETGLFTPAGIGYLIGTLVFTCVMTWLYLRTDRSILSAILIHTMNNGVTVLILTDSGDLSIAWTLITIAMNLVVLAGIMLLPWGLRTSEATTPMLSDADTIKAS